MPASLKKISFFFNLEVKLTNYVLSTHKPKLDCIGTNAFRNCINFSYINLLSYLTEKIFALESVLRNSNQKRFFGCTCHVQ